MRLRDKFTTERGDFKRPIYAHIFMGYLRLRYAFLRLLPKDTLTAVQLHLYRKWVAAYKAGNEATLSARMHGYAADQLERLLVPYGGARHRNRATYRVVAKWTQKNSSLGA